ncbi:MAG: carbohydrate-binding domain-containing protein [Oscillospiraceae bacterium]|nr:carbohydrate-binding domain-containing protein [Oscillospiraceae bacterium]
MKKFFAIVLSAALVLSFASCGVNVPAERENPEIPEVSENTEQEKTNEPEYAEFGERIEVSAENYKDAVEIVLADEITVGGKPVGESDLADVSGEIIYYRDMEKYPSGNSYGDGEREDMHSSEEATEHVLLTIRKPGKYFIKGELKGQIAVDLGTEAANDPKAKVTLIFGGADITCEIAPAVIFYNVYECENLKKEASSSVDTSDAGAVIIAADGSRNNIKGSYVAEIYKDKSGEEEKLHKYDAAVYSKMSMNIGDDPKNTGIINVEAENEGIGTEMHLTINGGIINVNSVDDGINTNEDYVSVTTVNGGKLTVKGGNGIEGDGIDSNGWLVINGGSLYSSGNGKSGDGGIDSDMGIIINGGNLAAFGSKNDFIESSSEKAFATFDFSSTAKAGSVVEFVREDGKTVKVTSDREFKSLVLSGDMIENGKNYKLYLNGVMQEYSTNRSFWNLVQEEIGGIISVPGGNFDEHGNFAPSGLNGKDDEYKAPEGLDKWLEEEEDIPEDIRVWIMAMKGIFSSENKNKNPGFGDKKGPEELELEEKNEDKTLFALSPETCIFSGIYDSSKETGKTRVNFTINGETRMENVFVGDLPGIKSIECSEKVPEKDVIIILEYSGRNESKEYSGKCLLSDGYEKINALFKGLPKGDYRLIVSVSEENEKFAGTTEFSFVIVE